MKFSFNYVVQILVQALRQGTTPRKLAVTCALGLVMGIFPVFGVTTLLCLGVAIWLKLNVPVIQLINFLVAPVQILLMIPFIKAGAYVFQLDAFPLHYEELLALFSTDLWLLIREAGLSLLTAVGVWALLAVPLFFLVFFPGLWFFSQWKVTRYREL
jgi:uncharacterized protein (DUF2062 family)